MGGYWVISLFAAGCCLLIHMSWEHYCLVGRLPIFAFGILFYLKSQYLVNFGFIISFLIC